MAHTLPTLPYAPDALEPHIDKKTMEIHHGKHHQAYVNNLNAALEKHPNLQNKSVEDLIADLSSVPADVRTAVVSQLIDLGYQVVAAENGEAALRKLESGIAVDLLFTDVIMPGGMNGKELAQRALKMRPDLKVLFTSGFPGTARSSGLDLEPGDALLGKPYRKRELAQRVRQILDA